ncbi:MAG TPA: hypothetical protein VNM90_10335 [Haliangium sp.]|nr:hypothetical protein [Haliangium sp.]
MRLLACTVLAAALASPACARRDAPYHFRAPLVSSVRADRLPAGATPSASAPYVRDARGLPGAASRARLDPERAWLSPPQAPGGRDASARPAPAAGAVDATAEPQAIPRALRALIGSPTHGAGSASFALATLADLGARIDARVRQATSGAHVLDLARDRDAVLSSEPPLTGDLVVLAGERHAGSDQDLLLGIVVMPADDAGGPVELVYAENGAVRHAVLAAQTCRDRQRLPADARCLGQERVRAFLALDRLAP